MQSQQTFTKLIVADIFVILTGTFIYLFFNPFKTLLLRICNSVCKLILILIKKLSKSLYKHLKIFKKIPYYRKIISIFIQKYNFWILLILLFIVLINFSYLLETGIWVNYHHHDYFIATINDLIQGKHMLVDTFNQYGLFWPLLFYFPFTTIVNFSYMNFYLLLMIFTYIYYVVLYFFIKKLTKSSVITLIGIFVILGVNTLFNYPVFPHSENYVWPGSTPLRYFFDSMVFLIVLSNPYFRTFGLTALSGFLAVYGVFHNFEMGISLAIAYIFLLFINAFFNKTYLFKDRVVVFIKSFSTFFISFIFIFLAFIIYTFVSSGQLPNWNLYIHFLKIYQAGFTNSKTPLIGWYYFHLFIYFFTLTVTLYLQMKKRSINWKWTILGAYSLYGLLILNYYLSRSYYSNLTVVSIPAFVIFVTLFRDLKKFKNILTPKVYKLINNFFVIVFIILSLLTSFYLYKRIDYRIYSWKEFKKLKRYPNNRGFIVANYVPVGVYSAEDLINSVNRIKDLMKNNNKVLLFSKYDSVILIMAEKTNVIPYSLLQQIHTIENKKKVIKDLVFLKDKPKYLFIDRKSPYEKPTKLPTPKDTLDEIFKAVSPYYEFKEQIGILDIYTLKNN